MPKFPNDPVICINDSTSTPAVLGEGKGNEGVRGVSHNEHGAVVGINDYAPASPPGAGGNGGWFESAQGEGVRGWSKTPHHGGVVGVNTAGGFGVYGQSDGSGGVVGESKMWIGVYGASESTNGAPGVMGEHKSNGVGVKAVSKEGAGLAAYSTNNEAIHAETHSPGTAAIAAYNLNTQGTGAAIFAKKEGLGMQASSTAKSMYRAA